MSAEATTEPRSRRMRFLDWVETAGNKLPDPAMLFVWALLITWVASALLVYWQLGIPLGLQAPYTYP